MLSSVEGERGYTVLSSPSSVLLCNLTLQAGESKTGERNCMLSLEQEL